MPDETRTPELWSCEPNAERYNFYDKDEAIENWLSVLGADHPETVIVEGVGEVKRSIPDTIEVIGVARRRLHLTKGDALEPLLEHLDEEYGDPDGNFTTPSDKMYEAEKAFLDAISAEYEVWQCEEVVRETVNVSEWIAAHRPGWTSRAA